MFLEDSWAEAVSAPLLGASCFWALLRILTSLPIRSLSAFPRTRAPRLWGLFTSILSCSATLLSTPPAFSADQAPSPRRSVEPPWSRTSGSPPLRPLVPARAIEPPSDDEEVVDLDGYGAGASYRPLQQPNPAVPGSGREPEDRGQGTLLFPSRVEPGPQPPAVIEQPSDPRPSPSADCHGPYRVVAGDSLWTIAGQVLDTDEPRVIARYWPRIHRSNRDLIGATPDLIRPGWVLELPPKCE